MIVRPIAEEMQEDFPDRHFEILGPFGLHSEVSIHFYKNGVSEKEKFDGDNCLSITFVPIDLNDEELAILDTETNTHEYPEGINRCNERCQPSESSDASLPRNRAVERNNERQEKLRILQDAGCSGFQGPTAGER